MLNNNYLITHTLALKKVLILLERQLGQNTINLLRYRGNFLVFQISSYILNW